MTEKNQSRDAARELFDPRLAQELREIAAPYIRAAELWDSIPLVKGGQA